MPCLRHNSDTFIPASCSRSTPMICSSVNRLRFIRPSPLRVADSTYTWRSFPGSGQRVSSDIESGLISSIANAARAETLDDLLGQAKEYHQRNRKEGAGILATAVYEDTIRR